MAESFAVAVFVAMLAASLLQILFRYVVPVPMIWTEEVARILNVAVTYLGALVGWRRGAHIRIDIVERRLPARARLWLGAGLDACVALFALALGLGAYRMANAAWTIESATLPWLKVGFVYAFIAAFAVGMLVATSRDLIERARALSRLANPARKPEP